MGGLILLVAMMPGGETPMKKEGAADPIEFPQYGGPNSSWFSLRLFPQVEPTNRILILETETRKLGLQMIPSGLSLFAEWYITDGWNGCLEFSVTDQRGLAVYANWYPMTGVQIGLGFDLLRLRPKGSVIIIF